MRANGIADLTDSYSSLLGVLVDVDGIFSQLWGAGFAALPLPSMTAQDDGLLWYRLAPDRIDAVASWDLSCAAGLVVPSERDWKRPFEPSVAMLRRSGILDDVVGSLLEFR